MKHLSFLGLGGYDRDAGGHFGFSASATGATITCRSLLSLHFWGIGIYSFVLSFILIMFAAAVETGNGVSFNGFPESAGDLPGATGSITPRSILPQTFGGILESLTVPPLFNRFLDKLGVEDGTPVDVFTCITEEDFLSAITELSADTYQPATPVERATVVNTVRNIFTSLGRAPPALGAAGWPTAPPTEVGFAAGAGPSWLPYSSVPQSQLPQQPQQQQPLQLQQQQQQPLHQQQQQQFPQLPYQTPSAPPLKGQDESVDAVPYAQYLDQSLKGSAPLLSWDELRDCRVRYEKATGAGPPEELLVTREQLSVLRGVIRAGRIPFADSAVFNVHGARLAKFATTRAQAFVDGQFVERRIEGPDTWEAWRQFWELFSVGMISLGEASVGSLGRFSNGHGQLMKFFPDRWCVLIITDLIVRSERWGAIREMCERSKPADYDPAHPWDYIIGASAYGPTASPLAAWWQAHHVLPNTVAQTAAAALDLIQKVEGHVSNVNALTDAPSGSRKRSRSPPPRQSVSVGAGGSKKETCDNWNWKQGACAARGKACPHGRRHICEVCGGSHRAADAHGNQKLSKGKDKGKGNGAGKQRQGGRGYSAGY